MPFEKLIDGFEPVSSEVVQPGESPYSNLGEGFQSETEFNKPRYSNLGEGFQSETEFNKPRYSYVPESLKGTQYEGEVESINKHLETQPDALDMAVDLDKGKLPWALETYAGVSPDVAAKVQQISDEKRIPFDTVVNNQEEYLKQQQAEKIYTKLFSVGKDGKYLFPATAAYLNNPERVAQVRDDIDSLTRIESYVRSNLRPWYSQAGYALTEGVKTGIKAGLTLEQNIVDFMQRKTGEGQPIASNPAVVGMQFITHLIGEDNVKDFLKSVKDVPGLDAVPLKVDSAVGQYALDFLQNLAPMAASIGAGAIGGPVAAGAAMGEFIYGSTYNDLRDEGVSSDRASQAAFMNAMLQAPLEGLGFGYLQKAFGATGMKAVLGKFLTAAIAEGGTEFLQQFPEQAAFIWGEAEKLGQTPEEQVKIFIERLPATAKAGAYAALLTAPLAILGAGVKLPMDLRKMRQLDADLSMWEYITGAVKDAKIAKSNPDLMEKIIDNTIKQNGAEANVYISAEALDTWFQSSKKTDDFLKTMGISKEKAEEARLTKEDIELSRARWQVRYSQTEESVGLLKDLRFTKDGMTMSEREEMLTKSIETLNALQKEYQAEQDNLVLPEEVKNIREKLLTPRTEGGFGMAAEDADASLSVLMAGAKVLSKQGMETTEQWFKRINPVLEVEGQTFSLQADQGEGGVQKAGYTREQKGIKAWEKLQGLFRDFELEENPVKRDAYNKAVDNPELKDALNSLVVFLPKKHRDSFKSFVENLGRGKTRKGGYKNAEVFNIAPDSPVIVNLSIAAWSEKLGDFKNQTIPATATLLGGSPKGSVTFGEAQTLIKHFKTANKSTFLHETAHIFVRDIERLIKTGLADEYLIKDYQTLSDFAGGDFEKMGVAFEDYLREGKAPSIKLATAFSKFRDWLLAIYKSVKGAIGHASITPEVSEVFDRILASEAEIKEAREYYKAKQSLSDLMEGFDEEEKRKLAEKKATAKQRSIEAQVKKGLKAYYKVKGGRKAITEQATQAVDARPAYQYIKAAQSFGGLDSNSVIEFVGEEGLNKIKDKHIKLIARQIKDTSEKAYDTYHSLVLSYGGINPASVLPEIRAEHFGKKGGASAGVFKKEGRGIDQIAEELVLDGLLEVPDNRNADDYLLEKLIGKEKYINPEKAFHLESRKERPDGITIDELAMEVNETPEKVIDEILNAERRSRAIRVEAKSIANTLEDNARKYLSRDETVNGEEAYHNDAEFEYLIDEANAVVKELKKRKGPGWSAARIDAKAIRDKAAEIVSNKKVKDATRYDLYAKAEKRFADKALDAMKAGNIEEALQFRQVQLLNHALVQEAVKARDEKAAIEDRYSGRRIQSTLDSTEHTFAGIAADYLLKYELNKTEKVKALQPKSTPDLQKIDTVLFEQTPEWLAKNENVGNYRELKMQQLRDLDQSLKTVLHYGRDSLSAMKAAGFNTLKQYVDKAVDTMQYLPDANYNKENPFLNNIEGFLSMGRMMEFIAERLDNFEYSRTQDVKVTDKNGETKILQALHRFGPTRELFNRHKKAEGVYEDELKIIHKATEEHWKNLRHAIKRLKKEFKAEKGFFEVPGLPVPENMKSAGYYRWTGERLISFVLNMGNEHGLVTLGNAYGYSYDQMMKIAGLFTASELKSMQAIWDAAELFKPKMDKVFFNIYNKEMSNKKPQPLSLVSSDGVKVELQGGYYPMAFDREAALKDASGKSVANRLTGFQSAETLEAIAQERRASLLRSGKVEDSFTKEVKTGHALPPLLSMSVWFGYAADAARYISHAELVRDTAMIVNDGAWQNMVRDKLGPEMLKRIKEWAIYQAIPERRNIDPWDSKFNKLSQLAAASYLLGKVGVGVKQRLAVIPALNDLGIRWVLEGYRQAKLKTSLFGLTGTEQYEKIIASSALMRNRGISIDREMRTLSHTFNPDMKSITIAGHEFTVKDIQQFLFGWLEMNDRAVNVPIWLGAYAKSMHETENTAMTEEERADKAIADADAQVSKIQPSNLPSDLSAAQRSEGVLRLFTVVASWSLRWGNRQGHFYRAWRSGNISGYEFWRHAFYEYGVGPVAALWLGSLLKGESPPDEPEEYAWALANNAANGVILLGPVLNAMQYGKNVDVAALEGFSRAAKAGKSTIDFTFKDKEFSKALWDAARFAEFLVGVPATNLVKEYKTFIDKE